MSCYLQAKAESAYFSVNPELDSLVSWFSCCFVNRPILYAVLCFIVFFCDSLYFTCFQAGASIPPTTMALFPVPPNSHVLPPPFRHHPHPTDNFLTFCTQFYACFSEFWKLAVRDNDTKK